MTLPPIRYLVVVVPWYHSDDGRGPRSIGRRRLSRTSRTEKLNDRLDEREQEQAALRQQTEPLTAALAAEPARSWWRLLGR